MSESSGLVTQAYADLQKARADRHELDMLKAEAHLDTVCVFLRDRIRPYLDDRSDIRDGAYGEPAPNEAMSLLGELDELLRKAGESQ